MHLELASSSSRNTLWKKQIATATSFNLPLVDAVSCGLPLDFEVALAKNIKTVHKHYF